MNAVELIRKAQRLVVGILICLIGLTLSQPGHAAQPGWSGEAQAVAASWGGFAVAGQGSRDCKRRQGLRQWSLSGEISLTPFLSILKRFGLCGDGTTTLRLVSPQGAALGWTTGDEAHFDYEYEDATFGDQTQAITLRLTF